MSVDLEISWSYAAAANVDRFRVYLAQGDAPTNKGDLVAEAGSDQRTVRLAGLAERSYAVRIVAVTKDGVESSWDDADASAQFAFTAEAPSAPTGRSDTDSSAAPASGDQALRISVDPVSASDPPQDIEVIKGPDEFTGHLVQRMPAPVQGPTGRADVPQALPAGYQPLGRMTGTEALNVRAVARDGHVPGGAAQVTVPSQAPADLEVIEIASVVGNTLNGFATPGAGVAHEIHATDGLRLRALSPVSAFSSHAVSSSLWSGQRPARYAQQSTMTGTEVDLGAVLDFVLDFSHEAQRKSAQGDSVPLAYCVAPAFPTHDPAMELTAEGPGWVARQIRADRRCIRPAWPVRLYYRAGTSSPLGGDYRPAIPGERVTARYVQCRLDLREPVGLHQLTSPRLYVRAVLKHGGKASDYYRDAGQWYVAGAANAGALTTGIPTVGTLYAFPLLALRGGTLDRLHIEVTTGGANSRARIGVYDNAGAMSLVPVNLLLDTGNFVTTGTGMDGATVSLRLVPGRLYWIVINTDDQGSAPNATVRYLPPAAAVALLGYPSTGGANPGIGWTVASAYGTLPSTFPGSPTVLTAGGPALYARIGA